MKLRSFAGSIAAAGGIALLASGCFATRVVRTDTTTSYTLVRAEPATAPGAPEAYAVAPQPAPQPEGTLVVEALVVPPAPAADTPRPVRLPSEVARASAVPAWDPLPSYVPMYAGPGWHRLPVFGTTTQASTGFRGWLPAGAGRVLTVPYGYTSSTGAYGSASPHFSSPPSYSGSLSSHFAGGYPGSGY